jgi:hypothetical protein
MSSPTRKPYLLRLDPTIHDAIQRWSDDEMRSMNAHIEYLLREALRKAGRAPAKTAKSKQAKAKPSDQDTGKDAS